MNEPQRAREEALARILSAQKMGLVKDPTGARLPDDLWMQKLAKAKALLRIVR